MEIVLNAMLIGGLTVEINKISLPVAYMIETLRNNGISDQELLHQIGKRDVAPWDRLNSRFDFNELVKFADQDSR